MLAGELAVADGDHTVAYPRYNEIMRRYAKIAGQSNAGRLLAPRTAPGIRARNWFLGSRAFGLMLKYAGNASTTSSCRTTRIWHQRLLGKLPDLLAALRCP